MIFYAITGYHLKLCYRAHSCRLFCGLLSAFVFSTVIQAACPIYTNGTLETVVEVVDGDTLTLASGVKVRLAGIDTAELGHGLAPDAPGSQSGKVLLERLVNSSGNQVRLKIAHEPKDRYGRSIAHVYSKNGKSIQEQILRSGWALGYARPPNLEHLECYRDAETQARTQRLGLWRTAVRSVASLEQNPQGFVRVQGKVVRVKRTRKFWFIELDRQFVIRVAQEDQGHFRSVAVDSFPGHILEARGYLNTYRGQIQMRIRHPVDWRIVN